MRTQQTQATLPMNLFCARSHATGPLLKVLEAAMWCSECSDILMTSATDNHIVHSIQRQLRREAFQNLPPQIHAAGTVQGEM